MLAPIGCKRETKTVKQAPSPPAPPQSKAQKILQRIPADPHVAVVILDWPRVCGLLGSLQSAMQHSELGRELVAALRKMGEASPLPIPWTVDQLIKLGIDPQGPTVLLGSKDPLLIFAVKDAKAFLARALSRLGSAGAKWEAMDSRGASIKVLTGPTPLACLRQGELMFCSQNPDTLVAASRQRPPRSLWSTLSTSEQERIESSSAIIAGKALMLSGVGSLRAEGDGVTIRLKLTGAPLKNATALFSTKGKSSLLGLAENARTVIQARANIAALLNLASEAIPTLGRMGLDPIKIQAGLTGELLLMEWDDLEAVLLVGSRNPALSQEVVEVLARGLSKQGPGAPAMKVTPSGERSSKVYRIQTTAPMAGRPSSKSSSNLKTVDLGLASSPAGILVGSWKGVLALSKKGAPKENPWTTELASAEEKEAFNARSILASRSYLGDPLSVLAAQMDRTIQASNLPKKAWDAMELGRFLLDQMHTQTTGVLMERDDRVRIILRLNTLHRDDQEEDAAAKKLWIKGLKAKYSGKHDAYQAILKQLSASHGGTRYGSLENRNKAGLLGSAFISLLVGTAMPAVYSFLQGKKSGEAHEELHRIAISARLYYQTDHPGRDGKIRNPHFPPTTAWTPAASCCKTGGQCPARHKAWSQGTWKALNISMDAPHYFQYRFINQGRRFMIEARADLNCDGKFSLYRIGGRGEKGKVTLSEISSQRPLE